MATGALLLLLLLWLPATTLAEQQCCFIGSTNTSTILAPRFSDKSTFADFSATFYLFYNIFRFSSPPNFQLYMDGYFATDYTSIDDVAIDLEDLYPGFCDGNDSLTVINDMPFPSYCNCLDVNTCDLKKWNVIVLTDLPEVAGLYHKDCDGIYQTVISVITSATEKCSTDGSADCYNLDVKVTPELADKMLSPNILYPLDFSTTLINFFWYGNLTEILEDAIYSYVLSMADDDIVISLNAVTTFTMSVYVNETFSYEAIYALPHFRTDYYNYIKFSMMASNQYRESSTFKSDLLADKMKEVFENELQHKEQANVLITDAFPWWLIDLDLDFTSMRRHLDIYVISTGPNSSAIREEVHQNFKKIIVDDANSHKRLNHILFTDNDNATSSRNELLTPTNQNTMAAATFKFYTNKRSYTWVWIVCGVVVLLLLLALLLVVFYFRRKTLGLKERSTISATFNAAPNSQFNSHASMHHDLFIDEQRLTIDFNSVVGKGSFGTVYGSRLKGAALIAIEYPSMETQGFRDCHVAVKIASELNQDQMELLLREVDAAKAVGWHRHICCLLGWSLHRGAPTLVYEFIDGTDLYKWASAHAKSSTPVNIKDLLLILWQIADGMAHIAARGLCHRDLAARNVLLSATLQAKITDFGLCSKFDESFTYKASLQNRLPIRWLAPETLRQRVFSEGSDVWAFGVTAWEAFSKGLTPYGTLTPTELALFLDEGKRLERVSGVNDKVWALMNACWDQDASNRPKFVDIEKELRAILESMTESYGYLIGVSE